MEPLSYGVNGESVISEIVEIPDRVMIDYMHLVFLGIFADICIKWFSSKNWRNAYYIGISNFMKVNLRYF
jgi:hypothetical protein